MNLKELDAEKKKQASGSLTLLLKNTAFDERTLDQILFMWLIQSALPWMQIKGFLLKVAFNYVQRGIKLNSSTWAATKAH
jgi:hypothetical protein